LTERSLARRGPLQVPPPPQSPAAAGHSYYLPEYYYLFEEPAFPAARTARVTALAIARWSTSYLARSLSGIQGSQQEQLPASSAEREAAIKSVLSWIERSAAQKSVAAMGLNLYQGDVTLLDQYDGFPGVLMLKEREFRALQSVWRREALPTDLYYLSTKQRQIVEPVAYAGGVARMLQRYTPLYWSSRDAAATSSLLIPSEDQRRTTFAEACRRFLNVLNTRLHCVPQSEMAVQGRDQAELERLRDLTMRIYERYAGRQISFGRRQQAPTVVQKQQDKAFFAACFRFAKAISLRKAELNEPGTRPDPAELADLNALMALVTDTRMRADEEEARTGQDDTVPGVLEHQ